MEDGALVCLLSSSAVLWWWSPAPSPYQGQTPYQLGCEKVRSPHLILSGAPLLAHGLILSRMAVSSLFEIKTSPANKHDLYPLEKKKGCLFSYVLKKFGCDVVYHIIHPFQMYDSVDFSIFVAMCNHHHNQFLNISITSTKKSYPSSHSLVTYSPPPSLKQPLTYFLYGVPYFALS